MAKENYNFEENFTQANQRELRDTWGKIDWRDDGKRQALAETIVKIVYEQIQEEDMTTLMADVEYFELKDTMQFGNLKGIKAWVHEPGSYAPKSVLVKKTLTLYEKMTSINPTINLIELDSGRYGSLADMKRDAKDEILGERYAAIWNTLVGSIAETDTNYATFADSGDPTSVKKPILDAALSYLRDIGAKPKAIVGRYSILDWIADLTTYSDAFKEVRDREGLMGYYKGVPVVYLQQHLDGYGNVRIGSDNICLVTEGTVKVGIKFDLERYVMEHVDVNTYDWNMHAAEMWGVGVVHPQKNYRIKVT